jgi:Spy/CpxP family protein refolding chaperone
MRKKTIVAAVVLGLIVAALAIPTFARGGRGVSHGWHGDGFGPPHEMQLEKMFHRLDLSAEQREQVFAVLDDIRPNMRRIHFAFADHRQAFHQLDPTRADYQEKLQGIASEVSKLSSQMVMTLGKAYAKVAALLTPEQLAQLQEVMQNHQRRPRRGQR